MQFANGMSVYTADNNKVGSVKQVVLNPIDQTVSHLIIERGFLFTTERVLPVSWIAAGDQDRLMLSQTEHDFETLPEFEEREYIPVDDVYEGQDNEMVHGVPYYYYGSPGLSAWHYGPAATTRTAMPDYVTNTVENIPANTVALDIGSRVTSADDEHVGDLDEVFTDTNGRVTHFVISQGFLFTTRKVIPTGWISRVTEDGLLLSVNAKVLERLPDYENVRSQ